MNSAYFLNYFISIISSFFRKLKYIFQLFSAGAFGWIAYNYLMKVIGPKKPAGTVEPYAVIEMGGASAQVRIRNGFNGS